MRAHPCRLRGQSSSLSILSVWNFPRRLVRSYNDLSLSPSFSCRCPFLSFSPRPSGGIRVLLSPSPLFSPSFSAPGRAILLFLCSQSSLFSLVVLDVDPAWLASRLATSACLHEHKVLREPRLSCPPSFSLRQQQRPRSVFRFAMKSFLRTAGAACLLTQAATAIQLTPTDPGMRKDPATYLPEETPG